MLKERAWPQDSLSSYSSKAWRTIAEERKRGRERGGRRERLLNRDSTASKIYFSVMHHRAYHLSRVSNSRFHGFSLWDRLAISRSRCNVLRQDREITRVYACIFRMQRRTLNSLENLRSYPRLIWRKWYQITEVKRKVAIGIKPMNYRESKKETERKRERNITQSEEFLCQRAGSQYPSFVLKMQARDVIDLAL